MTVPLISLYSGEVPNPNTQGPEVFSTNAVDWTNYQALNFGPDINATVTQLNVDIDKVDYDASIAKDSAETSLSNANFIGKWSANFDGTPRTGPLNGPASCSNNGSTWQLLSDIADVTAHEPGVSGVWQLINNSVSTVNPLTVSGTAVAGGQINQIRDSGSFETPLASSVPKKTILVVELPVWLANETPSLSVVGSDSLVGKDGIDPDGRIDWVGPARLTLTSNGVDEWSL